MAVRAPVEGRAREVLTPAALSFIVGLHRRFNATRVDLLHAREERQARIAAGEMPDFLPETRAVREVTGGSLPSPGISKTGEWRLRGPSTAR